MKRETPRANAFRQKEEVTVFPTIIAQIHPDESTTDVSNRIYKKENKQYR